MSRVKIHDNIKFQSRKLLEFKKGVSKIKICYFTYLLSIHICRWPHMDNWPNWWHNELCPLQPSHLNFRGTHHQQTPWDWHYLLACIGHDLHCKEGQGGRAQRQKDFGKLTQLSLGVKIVCYDTEGLPRQAPWHHLLHLGLAQSKPGWSTQACTKKA